MKPTPYLSLLALLCISCQSGGTAQTLPGVRMQTNPISGWTTVVAPDGAYSFEMPGVPSATTRALGSGVDRYRLSLEGHSRGMDVDVRPAPVGVPITEILEATEDALLKAWNAELEKSETKRGRYGVVRASRSLMTLTTHEALLRIQVVGGRIFVMTAIHLPEGVSTLGPEAERFFGSLRVQSSELTFRMHHDYLEVGDERGLFARGSCLRGKDTGPPSSAAMEEIIALAAEYGGRSARILRDASTSSAALEIASARLTELGYSVESEARVLPPLDCPLIAGQGSTTASASGMGSLRKDEIGAVIRAGLGKFKYCYESMLPAHRYAHGRVAVQFLVAPTGEVADARASLSTIGVPAVADCVVAVMKRLKFPPPRGGGVVWVTYPFVFTSK